jgi:hypothetical protein
MRITGWLGGAVGFGILLLTWCIVSLRTPKGDFAFERHAGFFEKILPFYLDIAKFIIGLAAGGIVLVIGSAALGSAKRLPRAYASPLLLLAMSVFYGLLFMPLLVLDYESFRHETSPYTRHRYIRNQCLGYSSLACFCIGYGWLIWAAANG